MKKIILILGLIMVSYNTFSCENLSEEKLTIQESALKQLSMNLHSENDDVKKYIRRKILQTSECILDYTVKRLHNNAKRLRNNKCANYPHCLPKAKRCGDIAGKQIAKEVCEGGQLSNIDWVWGVRELRHKKCLGSLPIVDAQSFQPELEEAFKSAYSSGLRDFKCETD